jgi:hypothetical protein
MTRTANHTVGLAGRALVRTFFTALLINTTVFAQSACHRQVLNDTQLALSLTGLEAGAIVNA